MQMQEEVAPQEVFPYILDQNCWQDLSFGEAQLE